MLPFSKYFILWSMALVSTLAVGMPDNLLWKKEEEKQKEAPKEEDKKEEKKSQIKPYDEVITDEAQTFAGLFFVHRVEDKVYFEIPPVNLEKPMLWVTQLAKTQAGHGYAGNPVGNRVVRWIQRKEDILLRDVEYRIRAEIDDPIRHAVEATSMEPIIGRFPIKAWGKDKAPVVEVTDLFLGDQNEFSAKQHLNASGADKNRSFIEQTKAFPENIETKVTVTYRLKGGDGVVTVLLHHSMVLLPEDPMHPRMADSRVGFFKVDFEDYGSEEHQVREVEYITRWRLEKKDPEAEISEPKEPIVFYVGRGVPEKWRSYVRQGIEAWQPAFEKAGFKNAIIAKEPPEERLDPDWDAEDARYSVIRWLPSTIENAYGPHIHDPRTGQIIEADIRMYHNVLKLVRDWYFVQVSPLDERAKKLPLPDSLMGELLAYVVSHEVGHSLGLPHNMKASSSYTVEQLRDPEFTRQHGHVASIMDYGRFNYVAQPGDNASLIPKISQYDDFAIEWGYRQFSEADSMEEEAALLDEIVQRQVNNPALRFGSANPSEDPSAQTEDLGSNPVEATGLGLKNIRRVAQNLVDATSEPGEDYSMLRNMYGELLGQWSRELTHVVNLVGGMNFNNLWYGQADRRYQPVTAEDQRRAVQFLNKYAFQTPEELLNPDILWRLDGSGGSRRILDYQRRLLHSLVHPDRIERMAEQSGLSEGEVYLPRRMLHDLRTGIWSELEEKPVVISLERRNVQRTHVDRLIQFTDHDRPFSEVSALARGELEILESLLEEALTKTQNPESRLHLRLIQKRIALVLHPPATS